MYSWLNYHVGHLRCGGKASNTEYPSEIAKNRLKKIENNAEAMNEKIVEIQDGNNKNIKEENRNLIRQNENLVERVSKLEEIVTERVNQFLRFFPTRKTKNIFNFIEFYQYCIRLTPKKPWKVPADCQEYADNGQTRNGTYKIKPIIYKNSFEVECEFRKNCKNINYYY